jgi:predicted nucleotide-binding protein (sugar kinase/HSP70/actin superfamily)
MVQVKNVKDLSYIRYESYEMHAYLNEKTNHIINDKSRRILTQEDSDLFNKCMQIMKFRKIWSKSSCEVNEQDFWIDVRAT